jgi:hypothetical protein
MRLEGIAIGSYSVQIEKGAATAWPLVVARAPAEVVAGQVTQVTLMVGEIVTAPPIVPVAGTLHLPAAWPRDHVELRIQPEADLAAWVRTPTVVALGDMEAAGAEEYRWSAGNLHAGGYTIAVAPCGTAMRVRVSDAGNEHVRIDAAPPTEVVLRFFDAASGDEVHPEYTQWLALRDGSGVPGARIESDRDGAYRFRAPIGSILVFADGEPFGAAMQELVVAPGPNELRFVGERPYGVDVSVLDGEQQLPWNDGWTIDLSPADGGCGVRAFTSGSRAAVTAPGRYRVSLGRVEGGATEETVTVERGAWTKVVVRVRH